MLPSLPGFDREGLRDVEAPIDRRRVAGVTGQLIGTAKRIEKVGVSSLRAVRNWHQYRKRTLGIDLLQIRIGQQHRSVRGEDALRMTVGEMIEQRIGIGSVTRLDRSLGPQIFVVVVEGLGSQVGMQVLGCVVGGAVVQHVSVSHGEICGCSGFPGVILRVAQHSAVGLRRASHGQLLRHGTQLSRRDEGALKTNALRGRLRRRDSRCFFLAGTAVSLCRSTRGAGFLCRVPTLRRRTWAMGRAGLG